MTRKFITLFGAVALVALLAAHAFAKEMTVADDCKGQSRRVAG